MDKFLILILSSFVAVFAWLTRFAIKEYSVFKKLKIPSTIFKTGAEAIFIIWICHIASNYVYLKMLPLVQPDKIEQINKIIILMVNKWFAIYFTVVWLFLWFCAVIIDDIAKNINKIRDEDKTKNIKINNK
jgi:hypothetical protein